MYVLDTTARSITGVLGAAITGTAPTAVVTYAEIDPTGKTLTEGTNLVSFNGTSAVTLLAAPASGKRRVVKNISVNNADSVTHTIYFRLLDTSTTYVLMKRDLVTLATYNLIYDVGVEHVELLNDVTPQLGGNLDCNGHTISGFTTTDSPQFAKLGLAVAADTHAKMKVAGQYVSTRATCTVTLDWDNGNCQAITLANGAQTFTFANGVTGGRYLLELKQPASGAAGTVVWPGTVKWSGASAPTLTVTNGQTDICTFYFNGTNYAGGSLLNLAL